MTAKLPTVNLEVHWNHFYSDKWLKECVKYYKWQSTFQPACQTCLLLHNNLFIVITRFKLTVSNDTECYICIHTQFLLNLILPSVLLLKNDQELTRLLKELKMTSIRNSLLHKWKLMSSIAVVFIFVRNVIFMGRSPIKFTFTVWSQKSS